MCRDVSDATSRLRSVHAQFVGVCLGERFVSVQSQWRLVMKNLFAKLIKDEQGGEVLEYALIAGLIVVAAIAIIGSVGTKVLGKWNSLNDGF